MKKPFIIHPYLFAVFPILFLFAHNIRELELSVIFMPIGIVFSFTFLLLLSRLILRDDQKAGILVSIALVLFFSYSSFYQGLEDLRSSVGRFIIGPHKILFFLGGIFYSLVAYFIIKTRKNLHNLTKTLNVVAFSLVLISVVNISIYTLTGWNIGRDKKEKNNAETYTIILDKTKKLPNIYYIILDAYGRADILGDVYHYDNTEFLNYLKRKRFYIADKSRSNYHGTFLSLASSLNLSYLDDSTEVKKLLQNNKVFSLMKQYGYTTVVISSWDKTVKISKADFRLKYGKWLDDFKNELINLTPIPTLLSKLSKLKSRVDMYGLHRKRINYVFDTLADTTEWNSPFFVYAHIYAPHPPFVFGPNGEEVQPNRKFSTHDSTDFIADGGTRDEYIKGYKHQLEYINKRLIGLINEILSREKETSIIILQGDHGPRSMADWGNLDKTYWKECYSILNAYYLPGNGNKVLYESITPVNTFRIIFNHYFDTNLELLKDESYFSTSSHPYKFTNVSDKIDSDIDKKHSE